jgi:hypothetical protein
MTTMVGMGMGMGMSQTPMAMCLWLGATVLLRQVRSTVEVLPVVAVRTEVVVVVTVMVIVTVVPVRRWHMKERGLLPHHLPLMQLLG